MGVPQPEEVLPMRWYRRGVYTAYPLDGEGHPAIGGALVRLRGTYVASMVEL